MRTPEQNEASETLRNELENLRAEVTALRKDAARLRNGLDFYATGTHFNKGDDMDWDTVSGEPPNFWCDEHGNMVEDGSIAKLILGGWSLPEGDDPDAPMIPPAAAISADELQFTDGHGNDITHLVGEKR